MVDKIVSVIIPIYNAEDSLHRCMESILKQSYNTLEIILINDGSTDQSGKICDSYAKTDERIKVVHQKNNGPSHARNIGIQIASGHYIQFVDADDYIKQQMTETLVKSVTASDQLVICGYQTIYTYKHRQATKQYIPFIQGVYLTADFMMYFGELYKDVLIPSPCNKLYDAHLIQKQNIHFTEDINYGEDLLFNLDYIKVCQTVQIIPDQLYNYLIASNHSLSRNFNENFRENQQNLHEEVKRFLLERNAYTGKNKHFMNMMYANNTVSALHHLFHTNSTYTSKQRKKHIQTIIDNEHLRQRTNYFTNNLQARIIGKLIKYQLSNGIDYFFRMKRMIQYQKQRH